MSDQFLKPINPKNKSLVARIAGNIVGGIITANYSTEPLEDPIKEDSAQIYAKEAVTVAVAIVEEVERLTSPGEKS